MSKITFEEDASSRKVTRFLLLSQIAGIGMVLGFRFFDLFALAAAVSFLTLILLLLCLLWLYARYRESPLICEKTDLNHLLHKFQKGVQKEGSLIQEAVRERELLVQAEKEEIHLQLSRLQKNHIEHGLTAASIRDADIPGIDGKLKEQIVGHAILSAADVADGTEELAKLEEPQRQALRSWRRDVLGELERTQPKSLTDSQLEAIQQEYQGLHAKNDAIHRKARASKQLLEHEIISFKARLRELAFLTFPRYLSNSLASRGAVAALLGLILIGAQAFSSLNAIRPHAMAVLPSVTPSIVRATPPKEMSQSTDSAPTHTPPVPTGSFSPSPSTPSLTASPVMTITATQTSAPPATLPLNLAACIPQDTARETGLVVGIVDGDTIDVHINGQDVRVRYIGINTPEEGQPFSAEATAYNQKLVAEKTVTLVKDTSETDAFNRLLRYVIVGDVFVNHELVALGYAEATAYPPDTACISTFETAQRKAQLVKVGLWMPTPEVYMPAITGGEATATCDPSYPGVCIPPPPPDLNCGEVQYRRFQVNPPDPHKFDRDGDGVGCEG